MTTLAQLLRSLPLPESLRDRAASSELTVGELVELLKVGGQGVDTVRLGTGIPVSVSAPTFGSRLKSLRLAKGLTQAQLAEGAGTTTQTVVQYESGRRNPSLKAAENLARALGISVADFQGSG